MNIIIPGLQDVFAAFRRIINLVHCTPVLTSDNINELANAELYFKCENLQKAGAFKFRGACNALFAATDSEIHNGVATHSSGNFAQALSLAAKHRGVAAYIVMPENAPLVKKSAVKSYGAEITFCKPTLEAREQTLDKVVEKTGAAFFDPYDNFDVICGQGTAAVELLHSIPELDVVMAPVGGGGLISGTAIAAKGINPKIRVYACEPSGADDAYRSFKNKKFIPSKNPDTIADGLLTSLGKLTFPAIMKYVDDILLVDDQKIIQAMQLIWERMKIVVEPSSAVPLAALMENRHLFSGKKTGIILSGGNVQLDKLPF